MSTVNDVNKIRSALQQAALDAWVAKGRRGTIAMATGAGKSKVFVEAVRQLYQENQLFQRNDQALLVVPTIALRDKNWPKEFAKWNSTHIMETTVKRICFASLHLEKGPYKLVGLDEGHRITGSNAKPFNSGTAGSVFDVFNTQGFAEQVMALTATEPDPDRDKTKADILDAIAPVCFRYPLDQAIKDGIVSDYRIIVIMQPLEAILKEIPGGTVKNPFMTTEISTYGYLNKKAIQAAIAARKNPNSGWAKAAIGKRAQFIYDLPSKTRLAGKIMRRYCTGDKRTLVFCGSIDQSVKLCGENVYNSSTDDSALDKLINGKINTLGVVRALNEGMDLPEMDYGVVVQANANPRDFVQRVGRVVRWREVHTALIWVIVAQGTVDEKWVRKGLETFDPAKITYDTYLNYL